jgi:hypothetical protein
MLRETEFPLFIRHGIEIIPTEVTPSVMTARQGAAYDDPTLAINKLWREHLTLPDSILHVLTRSRLWERDGKVSVEEASIFNKYVDAIYVPARLSLAIQIARWFNGIILFRYFGDQDVDDETAFGRRLSDAPSSILDRIIFVPVFRLLREKQWARAFKYTCPLHVYLDTSPTPAKWTGFVAGAPAAIVLSSVYQHEPFQALLRSLFPLAKAIPIKLLGKNAVSKLPHDIVTNFKVMGELDHQDFFREFLSSQFLIYPNSQRYHSHNVPLEAIYAGMPVVFRTETPTYLESDHPFAVHLRPSSIGASRSNASLMKFAQHLFDNENAAQHLIPEQSRLIAPFLIESVDKEMKALASLLHKLCLSRIDPIARTEPEVVFEKVPANICFHSMKAVVSHGFCEPISSFLFNNLINAWRQPLLPDDDLVCVKLDKGNCLQLNLGNVLGDDDVFFEESRQHLIQVDMGSKSSTILSVHVHLLNDHSPLPPLLPARRTFNFSSGAKNEMPITIRFGTQKPCAVVIRFFNYGPADVFLGRLKHSAGELTTDYSLSIDQCSGDDYVPSWVDFRESAAETPLPSMVGFVVYQSNYGSPVLLRFLGNQNYFALASQEARLTLRYQVGPFAIVARCDSDAFAAGVSPKLTILFDGCHRHEIHLREGYHQYTIQNPVPSGSREGDVINVQFSANFYCEKIGGAWRAIAFGFPGNARASAGPLYQSTLGDHLRVFMGRRPVLREVTKRVLQLARSSPRRPSVMP